MKRCEARRGACLGARRRFALTVAGFLLLEDGASGQPVYKIVMPDGRVVYSDTPSSGSAAIPEEVRIPEDPCKGPREAVQSKSADFDVQYRECAAAHAKEIKLSAVSRDLVRDRNFLESLERVQEERRRNPNFDAQNKGGSPHRFAPSHRGVGRITAAVSTLPHVRHRELVTLLQCQ